MRHTRIRVSRAVIAVLVVVMVIGAAVSANRVFRRAPQNAHSPGPATPAGIDQSNSAARAVAPLAAATTPPIIVTETPVPGATASAPLAPPAPTTRATPPVATAPPAATAPVAPPARATVARAPTTNPIGAAQAKLDSGDLLAARQILNDAFLAGGLSDAQAQTVRSKLHEIGLAITLSAKRFSADPLASSYKVQSGDRIARIAPRYDLTPDLLCRINGLSDPRRLQANATIKVLTGPFHAVVTKRKFLIDMYLGAPGGEGSTLVASFLVGLGKDDSTPSGKWLVQPDKKQKNPRFWGKPEDGGIIEPDDPKNPLGEYWIGLEGMEGNALGQQSYGIHGTIDENSLGKQESKGCVRMKNADVGLVYEMLVEGKSIVIIND